MSPAPLPPKSHKGNAIAAVVLAMVVIAGGLVWWNNKKPNTTNNPPVGSQPTPTPTPSTDPVHLNAANPAPALFPLKVPLEAEGKVINTIDEPTKAQRSFISSKTVEENYNLYKDYFEKNGWTITDRPEPTGVTGQAFDATKNNLKASFETKANKSGVVTVNIYFTVVPPKNN